MKSRVIPLIAIVLSVGIFYIYINPLWNGTIAATKAAIAQDTQALTAANQFTSQENLLTSERNAISPENLARLTTFLPDSIDSVATILDIDGVASRSGLTLSSIGATQNATSSTSAAQGSAQTQNAEVGSVDITLSATGTYSQFITFLRSIENSEELLDVQDLTVTGSATGVYTYQMTIQTYWLI